MLVAGAIIMLVIVLLRSVVIQVGAWFQDRRHLQVRADAGALAGAQLFNECFDTAAFLPADAGDDMEKTASQYAGFSTYNGTPLSPDPLRRRTTRALAPARNSIAFQSKTYPGGGGERRRTNHRTPRTNATRAFLRSTSSSPATWAECSRSRRSLTSTLTRASSSRKCSPSTPTFPLAIPEIVPDAVGVTFINEDTGARANRLRGRVSLRHDLHVQARDTDRSGRDPYSSDLAAHRRRRQPAGVRRHDTYRQAHRYARRVGSRLGELRQLRREWEQLRVLQQQRLGQGA